MYIVMLIREGRIFRHCLVARLATLPNEQLIIGGYTVWENERRMSNR